jgi:hypothetical protein
MPGTGGGCVKTQLLAVDMLILFRFVTVCTAAEVRHSGRAGRLKRLAASRSNQEISSRKSKGLDAAKNLAGEISAEWCLPDQG